MKILKRTLILLLLPLVVLAVLYGCVYFQSPAPDSATLVRTADRMWAWKGDPVRVRLHFNGDRVITEMPAEETGDSYVTALVIDHSGSMGSGPESALESAKMAASYFARVVATTAQPVGAIRFESRAQVAHEISPDGQACAEAILQIPSGGGTDIAAALEAGHAMVRAAVASASHSATPGLMILLSDGGSAREPAMAAAEAAKADGIRIITIGLGSSIDEALLRHIASSEADFHHTIDASALGDVYMNIAGEMSPVIGHAGALVERYHYGAFTLERPAAGFHTQVDEDEGRFEIRLPVVFAQRVDFPYDLRARKTGFFRLALENAQLSFVTDLAQPDQREIIESTLDPPLLVISPFLLFLLFLPALLYLLWRLLRALFHKTPEVVVVPPPVKTLVPPPALKVSPPAALKPREAQPTLFVGLGRVGGQAIAGVAELLERDRYLRDEASPPFRFLAIDGRPGEPEGPADPRFAVAKARLPASVATEVERCESIARLPEYLDWLPRSAMREATGAELDLSSGTKGARWPVRMALFSALKRRDPAFLGPWQQTLDWLEQQQAVRIVLVGSLESGTAALISDIAYLLHAALPALRSRMPIFAWGLGDVATDHTRVEVNQRASLEELDRFLLAPQVPQPMVYDPNASGDDAHLNQQMRGQIYQGALLLQSDVADQEQLRAGPRRGTTSGEFPRRGTSGRFPRRGTSGEFLSHVAALGHTLTEKSLAREMTGHLGEVRAKEELYQRQYLEAVVHTASVFVLRFPVPEIIERLSCRFIMEVLGSGRLVGVSLAADGSSFTLPESPAGTLDNALALFQEVDSAGDSVVVRLYQAFCQASASDRPGALRSALGHELGRSEPPALESARDELRSFSVDWFTRCLNGAPDLDDDAAAAWRPLRISWLYEVLNQLVAFGDEALRMEKDGASDTADGPLTRTQLIAEIQSLHVGWQLQVRRWLEALIDPGYLGAAANAEPPVVAAGLYRRANDRYQQLGERLRHEDALEWQQILGDGVGDSRWQENALYHRFFDQFLTRERGLLLRWIWELSPATGGSDPVLSLRLVTDQNRRFAADDDGVRELGEHLRRLADSRSQSLDTATIFDKLRSKDGELNLKPLAAPLARQTSGSGLRINRQYPGSREIERRILAMLPALEDQQRQRFCAELERLATSDVKPVTHHDPHTLRLMVIESVIPIGAIEMRRMVRETDLDRASLPFVFAAEQAGEHLRRRVEDVLGRLPCPPFHPLIRLLVAAPMPLTDWAALLAEQAFEEDFVNMRDTVTITDGRGSDEAIEKHQAERIPRIWALINVAYAQRGQARANNVLARWRARPGSERVAMLADAGAAWQERVEAAEEIGPEHAILEQIGLLLRLEAELARQREEES